MKLTYISMNDDQRAGIRAQYRELLDSAQTVDLLVQQYAEVGRSQDDLKVNKIFEIHMAKIALHDYKNRTSNHAGAESVSGQGTVLLPTKLAQKAAGYANSNKKLQNSKGNTYGGPGGGKGGPKGGKGAAGGPCYYYGEPGHIAKDCKKKADIEAGIVTPQAKGKAAARMRARLQGSLDAWYVYRYCLRRRPRPAAVNNSF